MPVQLTLTAAQTGPLTITAEIVSTDISPRTVDLTYLTIAPKRTTVLKQATIAPGQTLPVAFLVDAKGCYNLQLICMDLDIHAFVQIPQGGLTVTVN